MKSCENALGSALKICEFNARINSEIFLLVKKELTRISSACLQ